MGLWGRGGDNGLVGSSGRDNDFASLTTEKHETKNDFLKLVN